MECTKHSSLGGRAELSSSATSAENFSPGTARSIVAVVASKTFLPPRPGAHTSDRLLQYRKPTQHQHSPTLVSADSHACELHAPNCR